MLSSIVRQQFKKTDLEAREIIHSGFKNVCSEIKLRYMKQYVNLCCFFLILLSSVYPFFVNLLHMPKFISSLSLCY